MIAGIAHVNLLVPSGTLDHARDFYGKTLGLHLALEVGVELGGHAAERGRPVGIEAVDRAALVEAPGARKAADQKLGVALLGERTYYLHPWQR